MARSATRAKLTAMRVVVTGTTAGLETEEGLIQILNNDCRAVRRRYLAGVVTLGALKRDVFAFETVSSLSVIERRLAGGPSNQIEITAGVFGVTTNTIRPAFRPVDNGGVIPAVLL
jgi:hypothetical protein